MIKNGTENDNDRGASQGSDVSPDLKTSQILDDIAQTRAEMSGTLGELHEKLTPSALKEKAAERLDEAKDAVRDATLGKVETLASNVQESVTEGGRSLLEVIKANPIPLAMTGIGLTWLALNASRRGGRPGYRYAYDSAGLERIDPYDAEDSLYGVESRRPSRSAAGGTTGQVKRKVAGISHAVQDAASNVAGSAGNLARQAQDSLRTTTRSAGERANQVADDLRYQGSRLTERAGQTYQDNPLAVAAAVAVAGTALGLALPVSQRERELLGGAHDGLMREARGFARGALEKVNEAAKHVGGTDGGE